MKRKAIISIIAVMQILQTGVMADELASYGQPVTDNPYFAEYESIITLNANGGELGSGSVGTTTELELTTNKGRIKLPIPYRTSDYEFCGWYTEDGDKVSSDTLYHTSTTLYARWEITGTRTITFSTDGGSDIYPMTVKYGDTIDISTQAPKKMGYTFLGWYTDPRTKLDKVEKLTITEDVVVYAKWEQTAKTVPTVYKDHVYMTDEEVAKKRQQLIAESRDIFTRYDLPSLLELLRQYLLTIQ